MQDRIPNRNYLAAQNKNLIRAGDILAATIALGLKKPEELKEAIRIWAQAKENLMGLAGRKVRRLESEGKLNADAEDQACRQGKAAFEATLASLYVP